MLEPGQYVIVDTLLCRREGGHRVESRMLGTVTYANGRTARCGCCVELDDCISGTYGFCPQGTVIRPENLRPLDAELESEREAVEA